MPVNNNKVPASEIPSSLLGSDGGRGSSKPTKGKPSLPPVRKMGHLIVSDQSGSNTILKRVPPPTLPPYLRTPKAQKPKNNMDLVRLLHSPNRRVDL